ncbi:hypothetical protein J6590_047930, partial [Homalodisca vitripennis]
TMCQRQSLRSLWNKVKSLDVGKSNVYTPVSFGLNGINDYFVNLSMVELVTRCPSGCRFSFALREAEVLVVFSRMASGRG